jgi:hypothetical protein
MNTTIIKDTKHYYLNSNGGEIKNSYLKSDIIFNIPNLIKDEKNILYNTVSIVHCEIPYSFYIINEYNNLLSLSTGDIYIDYGNYNANSLISYLKTKLPTNMNITLNGLSGVFTLTYNQQFQIYETTTVYKVLGLQNKNYTSINNSIIFDYPCNFLGTKNLYIKSNIILDNFNSTTKDYITLSNIPVSVEPYSILLYNNYSNSKHIIKNKNLDNIEIKIYDDDNNLVDFNNTDWSITLEIESYINANFDNINLIQYLNGNNN